MAALDSSQIVDVLTGEEADIITRESQKLEALFL